MYKTKYGKVVKSNTRTGTSQIVWIKELNPLMFWKTYECERGINYKKMLSCGDVVKFLIDESIIGTNVLAVKAFGRDLDVKDLMRERV